MTGDVAPDRDNDLSPGAGLHGPWAPPAAIGKISLNRGGLPRSWLQVKPGCLKRGFLCSVAKSSAPRDGRLERAVAALRQTEDVPDQLLAHLSPLGWEHVNLTGDYIWSAERPVTESRDGFRPLRAAPDTARKAA